MPAAMAAGAAAGRWPAPSGGRRGTGAMALLAVASYLALGGWAFLTPAMRLQAVRPATDAFTVVDDAPTLGTSPRRAAAVPTPAGRVAMRGRALLRDFEDGGPTKRARVKLRQSLRSKAKQGAEAKMNKKSKKELWPVEIPEGIHVLHVEYDQDEGAFPQPGNSEVMRLYSTLQTRFGHKVRILANYRKALKELSPTGTWRKRSFEVVDLGTKKQLYSKLQTGLSLMQNEAWLDRWMDQISGLMQPA